MKNLHDCRFMQAVMSEGLCAMSHAELNAEFSAFQTSLREFATSSAGYLEIDFVLRDLHSILNSALRKKK